MYVYVCVCMYMYVWPQNCEIYRNLVKILVKISLIRLLLSVWQPSYDILFITFFCYDHYNLFNF